MKKVVSVKMGGQTGVRACPLCVRTFVASSLSILKTCFVKYSVWLSIPRPILSLVVVPAASVSCLVISRSLDKGTNERPNEGEVVSSTLSLLPPERTKHTTAGRRSQPSTHSSCLTVYGSCRSLFGNFSVSGTTRWRRESAGEVASLRTASSAALELTNPPRTHARPNTVRPLGRDSMPIRGAKEETEEKEQKKPSSLVELGCRGWWG